MTKRRSEPEDDEIDDDARESAGGEDRRPSASDIWSRPTPTQLLNWLNAWLAACLPFASLYCCSSIPCPAYRSGRSHTETVWPAAPGVAERQEISNPIIRSSNCVGAKLALEEIGVRVRCLFANAAMASAKCSFIVGILLAGFAIEPSTLAKSWAKTRARSCKACD